MSLRAMTAEDVVNLKLIHHKYYRNEFNFPDFQEKFLNCFVVESDGEIVTAGGVRLITEAVALTDKSFHKIVRRDALRDLLSACAYTTSLEGFTEVHTFIQDYNWKKVLLNNGFRPTKGEALVFQLGDK